LKGLWTTVTNVANGKSYFVSTAKSSRRRGLHEAAVFRKIFGPIANFWRPQAIFFGTDAADLHARVTALVRDGDPAAWRDKDIFISAESDQADAAFERYACTLARRMKLAEIVGWAVFGLALSWAICTNIALRQHYKHSDQPALP
jgi:hypothetical protein